MRSAVTGAALGLWIAGALGCSGNGADSAPATTFDSAYLGEIAVLATVPEPVEAEKKLLPFMASSPRMFRGKRVLEIGTATGIVGLYAAELGAERVLATARSETALRNAQQNAAAWGGDTFEVRLVTAESGSAFSGVGPDERFDVILADPPQILDLDAGAGDFAVDDGSLGPSSIRDLDAHLNPGGVALLLYNSLFYHDVMVKLARHAGFDVREHTASRMASGEAEVLFNAYLERLLERERVDPAAFRFDRASDPLGCRAIKTGLQPLIPGGPPEPHYGVIVIRRADELGGAAPGGRPGPTPVVKHDGTILGEAKTFRSAHLQSEITVLPGVFHPLEAENRMFPFMKENASLFRDGKILEIGTGSGMIAIYAAKLGAQEVVATDIDEAAIRNARLNAEALGVSSVVDARLVPAEDMSAYSVIRSGERFDVIISNPPYSLDLDAPTNTTEADTGDLGPSILRGLEQHLTPGGVAMLYYPSLFYHHVMVKLARHEGFSAVDHSPPMLTPTEAGALYNYYLGRLLRRTGMDPGAVRFDREQDALGCFGNQVPTEPLLPGNSTQVYPGMIVIRPGGS